MLRDQLSELIEWRSHPLRKPLILRGARQVGKSWLVRKFGEQFNYFIEINFEKDHDAKSLFPNNIDIRQIVKNLRYYKKTPIEPNETLIFLDEIQDCENALTSLRYFKEEYPELHVIAAGSLLDFAIERVGVPVGRVQFKYLYPLSFAEFLVACGREDLRELLLREYPTSAVHNQLLDYLKTYSIIGGMPDVIATWIEHEDLFLCQEAQDMILDTYRQDIPKYATEKEIEYVSTVFDTLPLQIGEKFNYSKVDMNLTHYYIKRSVELLHKAGVIYFCYHSSGQGHPLGASKNIKKFKLFFFDIGLAQRMLGLNIKDWLLQPALPQHDGAMAEQFVAQEFVSHSRSNAPYQLYYWHREAKSSSAEVDFLMLKKGVVFPVEVKSGNKKSMKSMTMFLESHKNSPSGIKLATLEHRTLDFYEQIPFYAIERFITEE